MSYNNLKTYYVGKYIRLYISIIRDNPNVDTRTLLAFIVS